MLKLPAFLRRLIRRHTKTKSPADALTIRRNISIVYAIVTWNLLGYIVYRVIKNRQENPDSFNTKNLAGGRYYADLLEHDNVILKRYKGMSKVGEWDLEEEKKQFGRLLGEDDIKALEKGQLHSDKLEDKYKVKEDMKDLEDNYLTKY